jgi:transcriptional regulator with GAF, ATPase, and Fis domain
MSEESSAATDRISQAFDRLSSHLDPFLTGSFEQAARDIRREIERTKHELVRCFTAAPATTFSDIDDDDEFEDIIGNSPSLRIAISRCQEVAPTDASVVLLGETGTGKELFARAVHNRSARRARPFVRVNCAALPPTLIESELFGHERGAFTGAVAMRQGRFELADKGTIFLDEIGDLRSKCRRSCCASFKKANSSASGRRSRARWTCAWWPPRIRISNPRFGTARSGRTCTTA